MRIYLATIFTFLLFCNIYAQNDWELVWSMHQKPFQAPEKSSDMAIVKAGFDTDEDGWGEFICAYTDLDSNFILMYEAAGNDTFDLVWYWKYPVPANSFAGIVVGDMDNNGVVEIITTMPSRLTLDVKNPPRLWVFEWNGVEGENKYGNYTGDSFEPTNSWNFNLADLVDFRPYSLNIEDIDKDGDNELIVGVREGSRGREVIVASYIGSFAGIGSWHIEYNFKQEFGGANYSVTTGDLDNDGNREIYAMIWNYFTLRIFESTGTDQYQMVTVIDDLYQSQGIDYGALDGIRVADVNNDGVNELYIAGTEPENTLFIITDITDVSQITGDDIKEFYHIPRKAIGKLRTMHVADMDGDGKLSLMIAGEKNGQIYDLEYKGEGDPADSSSWELTVAFDIYVHSEDSLDATLNEENIPRLFYGHPAEDMDNDGRNEYVFVNYHTEFEQWKGDGYVWIIETDNVSSIETPENLVPKKVVLRQNYPNPFNPNTTIEYALPQNQQVNITVYNILGQEIEVLVDEFQPAGSHIISFNGSHLPSGTYYVKLVVSDSDGMIKFQESKKLLLVK